MMSKKDWNLEASKHVRGLAEGMGFDNKTSYCGINQTSRRAMLTIASEGNGDIGLSRERGSVL